VRLMLRLWKGFCQRICNIQIRVYFAYLDITSSNDLLYQMKFPQYMFILLVVPLLLCLRNSPIVVTIKIQ
jgi:hypothetical protein